MISIDVGPIDGPAIREQLFDCYEDYGFYLDQHRFDDWLQLFTEDCFYAVVAKENADAGLPLGTMRCESRAMLADRIYALEHLNMYAPRTTRHFVSRPRIEHLEGPVLDSHANFLLIETIEGEQSRVHLAGRYVDQMIQTDDGLRFARRVAIYDTALIETSLVYPV